MKKLTAICLLFFAGTVQQLTAQTSINKISFISEVEPSTFNFISDISFTTDNILNNIGSGAATSIQCAEGSIATTKSEETLANKSISCIENSSSLQSKYAMMMNVDVESLKNISLLGFIEDWFGTRYRLGGTTKRGIDCSALTGSLLMAVYGFVVPRTARQQYKATEHISKEDLKEGDLVFFNTHGGVSHVGLYLDNNYFIHASSSQGVTISNLQDNYYAKRFICGGRAEEN